MLEEAKALRNVMQAFVDERLEAKLARLKTDQTQKRDALLQAHQLDAWIADAARRVRQIQLATHTLKPMHPDARGTNLFVEPSALDEPGLVGSHSTPQERASDVVGNAAALDVYKFLSLEHAGRTLLARAIAGDAALAEALSADPEEAAALLSAFVGITEAQGPPASHTLAKQVYFPVGPDQYHLLAPLFPTTLVHHMQGIVREHRFGDAAKAARAARREDKPWHEGFYEYTDLAIQKFGGTKPQNISQLNSQRYGENWLLRSLPPTWTSTTVVPPLHTPSVFDRRFGRRRRVRELVAELQRFLLKTSYNNRNIRSRRARLVAGICDEVVLYSLAVRALPSGWTKSADCKLVVSEQLWLDPGRAETDEEFGTASRRGTWASEVSARFANWLNRALSSDRMVFGDAEHHEWTRDLRDELDMLRDHLEAHRD